MPTPSSMRLPKCKIWDDFENICRDVLNEKHKVDIAKYGRHGQKQHGIDAFFYDIDGSFIVSQSKNYYEPKTVNNLIAIIKKDISDADQRFPDMKNIIIMTSMDRDTKLQDVTLIDKRVIILFWDDIEDIVCNNNDLLKKYYPSIFNFKDPPTVITNTLVPNPSVNFIGRGDIIKKIYESLDKNTKLVLLNGIGGIGKSQICAYMYHELRDSINAK